MKETDFPVDPQFDKLIAEKAPCSAWGVFGAHDPSLLYADGEYYAFSTGTFGENYYQIRRSKDLIHWQYAGQAFPKGIRASLAPVVDEVLACGAELKNDTLWAPDVVPAAQGGYWLYGCYSAMFGTNHSGIFLAWSEQAAGEYTLVAPLVSTGGHWGSAPNAIDPQIFYDGDRMYMTYGSFFGGIRILELDPATGLRKDGFTLADHRSGKITDEEYYGKLILPSDNAEGGVVHVRRGVPVTQGDVFSEKTRTVQKDLFYLVVSADSLFRDYNMRLFVSERAEGGFVTDRCGLHGLKLCSSFSWRHSSRDKRIGFDFAVPGHNDLFTTPDGVDLVVYHNRTPMKQKKFRPHYLFLSMFACNSLGYLVMSPNRYAGERLRTVRREELAGKQFDFLELSDDNRAAVYAARGLTLEEDGRITVGAKERGRWKLYGEYFIAFDFGDQRYHGCVMPAWIEAEKRAGLTVSARGEKGLLFFMNQNFAEETKNKPRSLS